MQMMTSSIRNLAIEAFRKEFKMAKRFSRIARLKRQAPNLPKLKDKNGMWYNHKRHIGIKAIPTDRIRGTIGRDGDFDLDFRPLKRHLQDRWVNAFVLAKTQPWSPIRAYKKGEHYFIEDGHHRVSVARHLGIEFIDAEVWEYLEEGEKPERSNPLPPALRLSTARMACDQC